MSSSSRLGGEVVTVQVGAAANWIGTQYLLLQNSNCDVNSNFSRSTHFRRSASATSSSSSSSSSSGYTPRVVCVDASVGLDGIVATFAHDAAADATEEAALTAQRQHKQRQNTEEKQAHKKHTANKRPTHWTDLAKHEEVLDRVRWFLEECDQPDGIHLVVDGNSGWSGVGSTLLSLLRDEHDRIPIFCISSLMPPAPASALGRSFSSNTSVLQSVLNSALLMNAASQLATAYLPITSHYWATNPIAQKALPETCAAMQRGEVFETATFMAWIMHLATADYRVQPRPHTMASALAGLTQQSQANILSTKMLTQFELVQQQKAAADSFLESASSSLAALTPVIHELPSALPLSLIGHHHSYQPRLESPSPEQHKPCCINTALTESMHVFGRTEEMSHQQIVQKMENQPPALYRRVYGTSRVNLPPSFPVSYYDLLNEGHVLSTYRCQSVGVELSSFGSWLSQLNRGAITASHYTAHAAEDDTRSNIPAIVSHMQAARHRNAVEAPDEDGDRTRAPAAEQMQMTQWTQDELDEYVECGTNMQNLAELY